MPSSLIHKIFSIMTTRTLKHKNKQHACSFMTAHASMVSIRLILLILIPSSSKCYECYAYYAMPPDASASSHAHGGILISSKHFCELELRIRQKTSVPVVQNVSDNLRLGPIKMRLDYVLQNT